MNHSLVDALRAHDAQPAVVPHAMRYFVSAWTDDLPPADMRAQLQAAGVAVDDATAMLERDAQQLEAAALSVLQAGWDDPDTREFAEGALGAARSKLPVVEAALIAIVAVYGMWLAATKGRRSQTRVIRRAADGSWEEIESVEWYGPSGPLREIASIVGAGGKSALDEPEDEPSELPAPE